MDKLKSAIETLASKVSDAKTADEAMKFAQAALNAANAYACLHNAERAR